MMGVCGTVAVSAAAAGLAVASPAAGASAPSAAPAAISHATAAAAPMIKYCGRKHVTVIVDLKHFHGGKVRSGCTKNPHTGLAALRGAGFRYTFVPRLPGFICRINHKPDKCNGAPSSAYWSYWHAKKGGKWKYSSAGAGSSHPKRGWVEGWAFGKGKPPRISPPS
jgi:hypothetical protein